MSPRVRREPSLRSLLANAPIAIFATDREGIFILSEGGLLPSLGLQSGENVGTSVLDLYARVVFVDDNGSPTPIDHVVRRVLAGDSLTADTEFNGVHCENRLVPLRTAAGRVAGLIGIAIDITERKAAELALRDANDRLRFLSRRLVRAREAERRHLARELHDEIGQALSAAKVELESIRRCVRRGSQVSSRLERSVAIVERALEQVRSRSLDLHPQLLDDLGLAAALRWLADRQAMRSDLLLTLGEMTEARFPDTVEIACFRIVQEAVANTVKHARAQSIGVELRQRGDALHVWVRDDGIGFEVGEARRRAARGMSLGLVAMEERAALAGGGVEWRRIESGGTEVHAWFDLRQTGDRVSESSR